VNEFTHTWVEKEPKAERAFKNAKSVERIIYGIIAYVLNQQPDMPDTEFTQSA